MFPDITQSVLYITSPSILTISSNFKLIHYHCISECFNRNRFQYIIQEHPKMDGFIDLKNIENEGDMSDSVETILLVLQESSEKEKTDKMGELMSMLNKNLESNASPKSKLMSIMIIQRLSDSIANKFLNLLAKHQLLKLLTQQAQDIDPKKPLNQKGRNFFPKEADTGNEYINIILECLKFWGEKYGKGGGGQATKYGKILAALNSQKVVLPTEYKYVKGSKSKSNIKSQLGSNHVRSEKGYNPPTVGGEAEHSRTRNHTKNQLMYSQNKIDDFMALFEDEDISPDDLQKEIMAKHEMFEAQSKKYQKMEETIFSENDEENTGRYIKITQFYNNQKSIFSQFMLKKQDLYSYKTQMQIYYQKQFQSKGGSIPKRPIMEEPRGDRPTRMGMASNIPPPSSQNADQNKVLVSNYMSGLEKRSKSPDIGFKLVKESISREKSKSPRNLSRTRKKGGLSPFNKSNRGSMASSLRGSKVPSVFLNPPNPRPPQKRYQGQVVKENYELEKLMSEINTNQGYRRFIGANFKDKNPLFENQHLQIGFKSQAVYESVHNFDIFISIQLFIGNKVDEQIRNLTLDYKGNSNVLLYANPRAIQKMIPPTFQNKHELMVVPLQASFPFINMKVSYEVGNRQFCSILIPSSLTKLAEYRYISKNQFVKKWNSSMIFCTEQFPMCHYVPPQNLPKWITNLSPMSSYSDFVIEGNTMDYDLFCGLTMLRRYQGLMKINIRPNMHAVIQIGALDTSKQAIDYFTAYLQTLQSLLRNYE